MTGDLETGSSLYDLPRIVVGVDGSANSLRALSWAASEARLRGCVLEIVHANFYRREILVSFEDFARDEKAILDHAVGRARVLEPGVQVIGHLSEPPADKALIDASDGAELLVVGSRGLHGFNEVVVGSVSNECAHHAKCPVVIVRPEQPAGRGRPATRAALSPEPPEG